MEDAIAIVAFIILAGIVIFAIPLTNYIKKNEKTDEIDLQKDLILGDGLLSAYLNKVDGKGTNKFEVISELYRSNNFEAARQDIKNYFDAKLNKFPKWIVEVTDSSGKTIAYATGGCIENTAKSYEVSHAIIPVNKNPPEYLIIRLSFGKGAVASNILWQGSGCK